MSKESKITLVQETLATKWKCSKSVFKESENVFIKSQDSFLEIVTFGENAVIRADSLIYQWCIEKFLGVPPRDILDGENLFAIETKLREFGKRLAGENVRYLYLNNKMDIYKPCDYEYKLFDKKNIKELNGICGKEKFRNALNYKNDVIALGAYKEENLVALAAADDIMGNLWQIGIDTLEQHRNKGIASYIVKTLADEIEKKGATPYYTTWSANIASTKVALSTGFLPVWVSYHGENL